MTKLMLLYLIISIIIIAALAPMPKTQQAQSQRVILPLYDALDLALAGKVRVIRYV